MDDEATQSRYERYVEEISEDIADTVQTLAVSRSYLSGLALQSAT